MIPTPYGTLITAADFEAVPGVKSVVTTGPGQVTVRLHLWAGFTPGTVSKIDGCIQTFCPVGIVFYYRLLCFEVKP